MNLKRISGGEQASIYVINPYDDIHADEYKKFVDWLDTHFPNSYSIDNLYLTIDSKADIFLALTFELV